MTQHAYIVGNSFKPDMDAYHAHARLLEKVGVISCMSKNISCSTEGVQVSEKGPFEGMFLRHPLTHPKSFHDLI